MRLSINQDSIAGLLFIVCGLFGLWAGQDYRVGTALRMGPGYLPNLLCIGLIALGVAISGRGFLPGGEKLTRWHLRPLFMVIVSVVGFAILVRPAGLVITAILCVITSSLASREMRPLEVALLSAGLAAAVSAVFVFGLGLPLALWPR